MVSVISCIWKMIVSVVTLSQFFTAIKKNDPAQLDNKAKWIKFTTKYLHKWYKQMVFKVMQKNKLTE